MANIYTGQSRYKEISRVFTIEFREPIHFGTDSSAANTMYVREKSNLA